MIPAGELILNQVYLSSDGKFALLRIPITQAAGSDVIVPHNLGFVPKLVWVASSEGKDMRCWFKVVSGAVAKDTNKATVQFNDTGAIVTLRIE